MYILFELLFSCFLGLQCLLCLVFFPVRHAKNCFRTFFGLKIIALALVLTDNNDSMPFLRGESERSVFDLRLSFPLLQENYKTIFSNIIAKNTCWE